MKILYISGMMSPDEMAQVIRDSRVGVDVAADTLCHKYVEGLEQWLGAPVELLGDRFVPCWPGYPRAWLPRAAWSHAEGADDLHVEMPNIHQVMRKAYLAWRLPVAAARWARAHPGAHWLVVYAADSGYLRAAQAAKRVNPRLRTVLIVPDLPEYMDMTLATKPVKRWLKGIDCAWIRRLLATVDLFVFLTAPMRDALPIGDRPFLVIEGMVSASEASSDPMPPATRAAGPRVALYTGGLSAQYGTLDLLEAFRQVDGAAYGLWLCGDGDARPAVEAAAAADPRIRWLGMVSRAEALRLQRQATVLVNPRAPGEAFCLYSFPSKTMEYMLSGTPVLLRRLPGIPNEYFGYAYVDEEGTVASLAAALRQIFQRDAGELAQFGARARQFVLEHKNSVVQVERLWRQMESLQERDGALPGTEEASDQCGMR